jgi:hypothetical protein
MQVRHRGRQEGPRAIYFLHVCHFAYDLVMIAILYDVVNVYVERDAYPVKAEIYRFNYAQQGI